MEMSLYVFMVPRTHYNSVAYMYYWGYAIIEMIHCNVLDIYMHNVILLPNSLGVNVTSRIPIVCFHSSAHDLGDFNLLRPCTDCGFLWVMYLRAIFVRFRDGMNLIWCHDCSHAMT